MDKKSYFCWVRVIPAGSEGGGYETAGVSTPPGTVGISSGPKRPKRTKVTGKQSSEAWFDSSAVEYGNPSSDVVFDFGPAYGDPVEAEEWLEKYGQSWAKEATNFFLLQFEHEKP